MAKIGASFHDMSAKTLKNFGKTSGQIKLSMAFRELETKEEKISYLKENQQLIQKEFDYVNFENLIRGWEARKGD